MRKDSAASLPMRSSVWGKSSHDDGNGIFERAGFKFDAQNNRYVCPAVKLTAAHMKQHVT